MDRCCMLLLVLRSHPTCPFTNLGYIPLPVTVDDDGSVAGLHLKIVIIFY